MWVRNQTRLGEKESSSKPQRSFFFYFSALVLVKLGGCAGHDVDFCYTCGELSVNLCWTGLLTTHRRWCGSMTLKQGTLTFTVWVCMNLMLMLIHVSVCVSRIRAYLWSLCLPRMCVCASMCVCVCVCVCRNVGSEMYKCSCDHVWIGIRARKMPNSKIKSTSQPVELNKEHKNILEPTWSDKLSVVLGSIIMQEGQRVCMWSWQTHWSYNNIFLAPLSYFSIRQKRQGDFMCDMLAAWPDIPGSERACLLCDVLAAWPVFLAQNWLASCAMCWQLDLMFLAQKLLASCAMCWQLDLMFLAQTWLAWTYVLFAFADFGIFLTLGLSFWLNFWSVKKGLFCLRLHEAALHLCQHQAFTDALDESAPCIFVC